MSEFETEIKKQIDCYNLDGGQYRFLKIFTHTRAHKRILGTFFVPQCELPLKFLLQNYEFYREKESYLSQTF